MADDWAKDTVTKVKEDRQKSQQAEQQAKTAYNALVSEHSNMVKELLETAGQAVFGSNPLGPLGLFVVRYSVRGSAGRWLLQEGRRDDDSYRPGIIVHLRPKAGSTSKMVFQVEAVEGTSSWDEGTGTQYSFSAFKSEETQDLSRQALTDVLKQCVYALQERLEWKRESAARNKTQSNQLPNKAISCLFQIIELLFMGVGIVLIINGVLGSGGSFILGLFIFGIGAISNLVRWKRALDRKNAR